MFLFYKMFQIDLFPTASLAHLREKGNSESIKPEGILSNFCFLLTRINAQSALKIVIQWKHGSLSTFSMWGGGKLAICLNDKKFLMLCLLT